MFATKFHRLRRYLPQSLLTGAVVLFLSVSAISSEDNQRAPNASGENPHTEIACSDCHVRIPERGETAWSDIAAGLTAKPVVLCRNCHPESEVNHHPVNRKTTWKLPEGLPVSAASEVICSTCHDVHLKGEGVTLLRGFDTGRYAVRMDICLDCHGPRFSMINPHRAESKSDKCYTCHSVTPSEEDTSATVTFKRDILDICNFCHNVKEKGHPMNVEPLRKLPDSLPRGKTGDVNCGTCHDPHGTSETLHYLRATYMEFLEAGRYLNPHREKDYVACLGCHLEISTKKEEMREKLRYGGDDILICHSCHGAMDSCHPILVRPASGMNAVNPLPLSEEGKIVCLTCHDPMPSGDSGVAIRGRKAGEAINAICFRCHDQTDLASRNPHSSMKDRKLCKFCHDTMTDPTNEEAGRVSFISNTRLICLRCHPQEAHPMGVNHMVVPKRELPELFRPDSNGKIVCTTCHNPHIDTRAEGGERSHRFVVDGEIPSLCSHCHPR
jgi:hypothetical protein